MFKTFSHYSYKIRIIWIICCLLIGAYLIFAIPINTQTPTNHTLEIIATGNREPQAKGSEIWINSIQIDGQELDKKILSLDQGWELRDDALLSYQNQPAILKYNGLISGDLTITFVSHPWSGQTLIILDGHDEQILNLYSDSNTTKTITLSTPPMNIVLHILIIIAVILIMSFFIFFASVWLITRPKSNIEPVRVSRWSWLWYSLPFIVTWLIYLLAYWPGVMSPDSIDQWGQMLSFKFNDWHPAFHTLTNWVITRLWLSPAVVALAQIIALSFVLGWGLSVLRRFGAPRWTTCLSTAILILIPSTGLMVITLWKDVFYSIAVVALSIQVFEITMTQGRWINKRANWVLLGVVSSLVALYRHNGPAIALGVLFCLLIVYRRNRKNFAKAFLLVLLIWGGIRGPVYNRIGVEKAPSGIGASLSHLIARYTNSNTLILPSERSFLHQIRPEDNWPYDCLWDINLFYDGKFNFNFLNDNNTSLAILSAKLIYRNPGVFLDHVICNSSFIYRITQPPNSQYETVGQDITPNSLGLVSRSLLPGIQKLLELWEHLSSQSLNWLIWRVPIWGYLFLASILVLMIRLKNWRVILVVFPILLNSFPLPFLTTVQALRYVFPTLLVSILMSWPFLFISCKQSN